MAQLEHIVAIAFLALICCHAAKAISLLRDDLVEFENLERNITVQLIGIKNVEELVKQNQSLEMEELTPNKILDQSVVYILGRRVRGDKLVAHVNKTRSWKTPQNVKTLITYPAVGVGAPVTFVYIEVFQTTRLGKAYIIRGGIHQKFITIALEGHQVTHMHFNANIFGISSER